MPAFINETPTQEEIDASPALAALQALKYEETDPHGKLLIFLFLPMVNLTVKIKWSFLKKTKDQLNIWTFCV